MKKILVKDCLHCPYMHVEVKDFQPPFPLILYCCSALEWTVVTKQKLERGYTPEWCPLEDV